MIRAILFDMDGVIADTDRTRFDLLQVLLKKRGLELKDEDYKQSVGKRTEVFLKELFGEQLSDEAVKEIYTERKEEYRKNPEQYVVGQPSVFECCQNLSEAGLTLTIASASEEKDIHMVLNELKLTPFFTGVVGSDTIKHLKPHPETYLKCMEKFGLNKEECIAIEDSPTGIRSAKASGVFCIAVTSTHVAEELSEADAIISSLAELTSEYISKLPMVTLPK